MAPASFQVASTFLAAFLLLLPNSFLSASETGSRAVPIKKFIDKHEKSLTISQKMKLGYAVLDSLESLHHNKQVHGNLHFSKTAVVGKKKGKGWNFRVVLPSSKNSAANSGSLQKDIKAVGDLLDKIMRSGKSLKKTSAHLPSTKRFMHLIAKMRRGHEMRDVRHVKDEIAEIRQLHTSLGDCKKRAFAAVKAMGKLSKSTGLSKKDLKKMALFIEMELKDARFHFGDYLSRKKTRLPRTIQVDPKSGKVFIHLKEHNVKKIGQGTNKLVTRSILYSHKNPKIVAHCENTKVMHNEIEAIHDLKGLPGLYKVHAVLKRKQKGKPDSYSFMSKLYSGDLHDFMKKHGRKISLKQKLSFAQDIMVGLQSMHKKKYAHRDLGLKNYLVEKRGKKYRVIIGDFGRSIRNGNGDDRGAQGGYTVNAPEGYTCDSLQGDDYLRTDIYAVGCVFYKLLYNKKPVWYNGKLMKNHSIPVSIRQDKLKNALHKYMQARPYKKSKSSVEVAFGNLITRMVDPDPRKRPTASTVRRELADIIKYG